MRKKLTVTASGFKLLSDWYRPSHTDAAFRKPHSPTGKGTFLEWQDAEYARWLKLREAMRKQGPTIIVVRDDTEKRELEQTLHHHFAL